MNRGITVSVAGLVTIALLLALAGCSGPGHPAAPKVVWSVGVESALATDPAVRAVRAADVAWATAVVTRDFSRADLRKTESSTLIAHQHNGYVTNYAGTDVPTYTLPGPSIQLPVSVKNTPEGATVVVCDASRDWYRTARHKPAYDLTFAANLSMTLKRSGDSFKLVDMQALGTRCDATGAAIGRFSPTPALPASVGKGDVIPPKKPAP
ncbi:hypothetical protein [Pseudolysinimonas sp.]|uniref:hypothetical protein n=1 Tax=Pseudolysinimonas sp. TaxID=2680009 RepID=UPI003F806B76